MAVRNAFVLSCMSFVSCVVFCLIFSFSKYGAYECTEFTCSRIVSYVVDIIPVSETSVNTFL